MNNKKNNLLYISFGYNNREIYKSQVDMEFYDKNKWTDDVSNYIKLRIKKMIKDYHNKEALDK